MNFKYIISLTGYFALRVTLYEHIGFGGKALNVDLDLCQCTEIDPRFGASSAKWEGSNYSVVLLSPTKERFWNVDEKNFPTNFVMDKINDEVTKVCWFDPWGTCYDYGLPRRRP